MASVSQVNEKIKAKLYTGYSAFNIIAFLYAIIVIPACVILIPNLSGVYLDILAFVPLAVLLSLSVIITKGFAEDNPHKYVRIQRFRKHIFTLYYILVLSLIVAYFSLYILVLLKYADALLLILQITAFLIDIVVSISIFEVILTSAILIVSIYYGSKELAIINARAYLRILNDDYNSITLRKNIYNYNKVLEFVNVYLKNKYKVTLAKTKEYCNRFMLILICQDEPLRIRVHNKIDEFAQKLTADISLEDTLSNVKGIAGIFNEEIPTHNGNNEQRIVDLDFDIGIRKSIGKHKEILILAITILTAVLPPIIQALLQSNVSTNQMVTTVPPYKFLEYFFP